MRLSAQGRLRGVDVAEHRLALAINGRERLLETRLVPFSLADGPPSAGSGRARLGSVAIVGLGYVGLPTALALLGRASRITGFDVSDDRLRAIESGDVDLSDLDRVRLAAAHSEDSFLLTSDSAALAESEAVIVCVPTPVDAHRIPDLTALQRACQTVVEHAHSGQTIILTSTSYAGTTRQLLIEPLQQRGMTVGKDVYVAFSPERIDPGNPDHVQRETPRVVGGATTECSGRAARVIGQLTDAVYLVSSPEAAELTKLYENIFRAVTLALANEFADVCGTLGLDPIEVTLAAATKPYGFLGTFPGPGVGGHCIPCDPHYLLWQLRGRDRPTPLIEQAMQSIHARPARVVERAGELLTAEGRSLAGVKVIVVGASYKAGVSDVRESPALPIIDGLAERGADVHYHDSLVPVLRTPHGRLMRSVTAPRGADWDLAVIHVVHPRTDDNCAGNDWIASCPRVLDATYQFNGAPHGSVV
ncbi:MAG TPA: nucleotide sugar dehydrogenase [Pseudonocardiaceae bacterium]|nr:nucleotide sugar dehydrogenase [Pseudonocardiaceae bacterium]